MGTRRTFQRSAAVSEFLTVDPVRFQASDWILGPWQVDKVAKLSRLGRCE
jgi:hypothetical protein